MPIYEFICEECGEMFEELVRSASDTQGVICPACQGEQVKKRISIIGSMFSAGKTGASWSAPSCNTGSV